MNRRAFIAGVSASAALLMVPTIAFAEDAPTPITLTGNAHDLVPMGTGEGVEVVAIGDFTETSFKVLIRNHTDEVAHIKKVICTVIAPDGEQVGSTDRFGSDVFPEGIEAQGVGIAIVSIDKNSDWQDIPLDASFTYEFELTNAEDTTDNEHRRSLTITNATLGADEIVVSVKNQTGSVVTLAEAFGTILNPDGSIQGFVRGRPDQEELAVDEEVTFSASYISFTGPMTDLFLIGAAGYI